MPQNNSKRPIDVEAEESYSWLSKSFSFIQKSQIKTWHAIFIAAFLGGVAFAIGMTVSLDLQTSSKAASFPIKETIEKISSRKLLINIDPKTPSEAYLVMNTQNQELARFQFQAESDVDLKVGRIIVWNKTTDFNAFSNIDLYNGDQLLGTSPTFENKDEIGVIDFSGLNFIIPKGQSVALRIEADVNRSGVALSGATHQIFIPENSVEYVGILPYAEKIPGEIKYKKAPTVEVTGNRMTVYATNLKVSLNSNSPSGIKSAGSSIEIARYDFSALSSGSASVSEIAFVVNATGKPITGKGTLSFKDKNNTTLASVSLDWTTPLQGVFTLSSPLEIFSGETQTYRIFMDTIGFTINQTLQASLNNWTWSDGQTLDIQPLSNEIPVSANEIMF